MRSDIPAAEAIADVESEETPVVSVPLPLVSGIGKRQRLGILGCGETEQHLRHRSLDCPNLGSDVIKPPSPPARAELLQPRVDR